MKEDGKKRQEAERREREKEREPVRIISLETPRDTIENVRGEARKKEREKEKKLKDIKSVSQRWKTKEEKRSRFNGDLKFFHLLSSV